MPIYEYQCLSCGKRTELLQRMADPPLATCPECGGEVKKLISAPAVQFKGSGWYVTDYAGKKGGASKGEASSDSKGGSKGEASESKPESKSESKSESSSSRSESKGESTSSKSESSASKASPGE